MLAPIKGSPFGSTILPLSFPLVCAKIEYPEKKIMIAAYEKVKKNNFLLPALTQPETFL